MVLEVNPLCTVFIFLTEADFIIFESIVYVLSSNLFTTLKYVLWFPLYALLFLLQYSHMAEVNIFVILISLTSHIYNKDAN